jgi:phage shock protein C
MVSFFRQNRLLLRLPVNTHLFMEKKLVRKNKKIFGVCGGLGEYFDMDPTVIRIIFLIGFLVFGTSLLVYLIMALVMPEEKPAA